jgi:hypothetical protein
VAAARKDPRRFRLGFWELRHFPSGSTLTLGTREHLVPASDGGDDFMWIGGSDERLGSVVGFLEEAIDGGLEIDDRMEDPALRRRCASLAKKPSTALSQEAEVGVKWKTKRG